MESIFSVKGRIAVITGALGKLGLVWTKLLLEHGGIVVAIDVPSAVQSDQFIHFINNYKERLFLFHADVSDKDALKTAAIQCVKDVGIPDILVNNAGIDQPPGLLAKSYLLEEIPSELFRSVVDVNLTGVFHTLQVFGGLMLKQRRGSIINIGSLYAGVSPDVRMYDHIDCDPPFLKPPAYGASKAAVVNLTRYFSTHWGPYGIRVNALSPGGVEGNQDEVFKTKFCDRVPLGRMATIEDLKGPFLFLASDASQYVTGIELKVDGGFTAW